MKKDVYTVTQDISFHRVKILLLINLVFKNKYRDTILFLKTDDKILPISDILNLPYILRFNL